VRGRAANLEAGIHFRARRFAEARAALDQVLLAATEDSDLRSAKAKLRALDDERARESLGRVLWGDERGRALDAGLVVYLVSEFARQFPDEALGPYLVGRQLVNRDAKLALPQLAAACPFVAPPKRVPLEGIFFKECRRLLGEAAYLVGDFSTAREAQTWLAWHAERESDRLRANDFLQRIAWKDSHG
jgi:hypothetical protein